MRVTVTATARLHFGFLDPSGRGKRPFGSFGLSLDRPGTRLSLQRAESPRVTGPEHWRAEGYLKTIAASCGMKAAHALTLSEIVPSHAGLGSGTQLALAVGSAFSTLEGLDLSLHEIARRLQRGARSGIGIFTFEQGGAVLDSGPRPDGELPALVSRLPFPAAWRVLLIFDAAAKGLAGASEAAAFSSLPDFPEAETRELSRRLTDIALPALGACDFDGFCEQIGYLQRVMGAYFAPLQGGPYSSAAVSEVLAWLARMGLTGIGQSSWGPTGFAFVPSEADGAALLREACARASHAGLSFELAQGRNEGAVIETTV
ncbi:GHMP kinase [Methyloceanibacter sp.]|uniref:GHMP family kinase ATP-binding protein n=1 Tax=Methyloceanibacter sp. TaxID=1965321 RepID=UPI002D675E44|nr:GHMP kinase [Methyloceanibacter sp.]HZP08531.1 GHMP kinase [Methyloceanibacter sp.]